MEHTFLFQEGLWVAKGFYCDQGANLVNAEGETSVRHTDDLWIIEGRMKVMDKKPVKFTNSYNVVPFEEGKDMTTWEASDPALGVLIGRYILIKDSIVSLFESENGEYWGTEFLMYLSDTVYANRGFILHGDVKLSSWSLDLTKKE